MKERFRDRLIHGWNVFTGKEQYRAQEPIFAGSATRPDKHESSHFGNKRTIAAFIYNRIAVDCAQITVVHSRLNDDRNYSGVINDDLNQLFTVEANKDQTGRAFMQDVVESMLDEGYVAIVPTFADENPITNGSYNIKSWRTGEIKEWYPNSVRVKVYNENAGRKEEIVLPKKIVGIIENPFYATMNEPNSILQRLIYKMNLLDKMDDKISSGKLDLIIQLPYVIKTKQRQEEAEKRRKQIEDQLSSGKYGIAYTDGTEKIVQLNRPLENNLLTQVENLQKNFFAQLGMSENIFNGTATEEEKIDYYNRTIEPILAAVCNEIIRKFLTKTARSQNQWITFFRDPFKMATIESIAKSSDQLCRNGILSPNEIRPKIGYAPSEDPNADQLYNRNMPNDKQPMPGEEEMLPEETTATMDPNIQNPLKVNINDL